MVDYKTGSKTFDVVSLYQGLQLQLMVYIKAAAKREQELYPGKEIIPSGVFYYRIQDPFLDGKVMDEVLHGTSEEKEQQIQSEMLKALRPDGLVNLSGDTLRHLDKRSFGDSIAAPLKHNKTGGLSKASKVASETEFDLLMRYAEWKVRQTHQKIADGEVLAIPYRKGTETGCDYCAYRHICGFDLKVPGYHYQNLEKMTTEQAIQKMAAACGQDKKRQASENDNKEEA